MGVCGIELASANWQPLRRLTGETPRATLWGHTANLPWSLKRSGVLLQCSNSLKTNSFLVGETLSKCQNLAPASSTTQDTATHWKPQSVAVFLCASVSCGVPKFAPISHGIRTDHLDAATRALIVSANTATCLAVTILSMMDIERWRRSPRS